MALARYWPFVVFFKETLHDEQHPEVLNIPRPTFDQLPLGQGDPKGSAWGLWGADDELGSLNLITDDVVRAAFAECRLGRVVNLKYPHPRRSISTFIA